MLYMTRSKRNNVGIAIINHPPNQNKWVGFQPSNMGGLLLLYPHYEQLSFSGYFKVQDGAPYLAKLLQITPRTYGRYIYSFHGIINQLT